MPPRFLLAAAISAASFLVAAPTLAADSAFPSQPVSLVVGFSPGGGSDVIARRLAQELTGTLGQPMIVDSKPGAAGAIALRFVARARPDGYTLALGSTSGFTVSPFVQKLPYDVRRDFVPVRGIVSNNQILYVRTSLGVSTVAELIAYAKKNPGKLNFGNTGNGSITQIWGLQFAEKAGIDVQHIPYKGNAGTMQDLAAGLIDIAFDGVPVAVGRATLPSVRALATTGEKRDPAFPNLPTMQEAGVPGFVANTWWGLFAPAGTPAAIVARLNAVIDEALAKPAYHADLTRGGYQILDRGPETLTRIIDSESKANAALVQRHRISLE
ncbi:MAG: Bug family tripartite tricarboxylate transporter substrate binding protein [Pigmentiphaga sp.]|uniref:Bug family tripartite tricarboxylate transporter substrate binding protein n=1 Tax=Pigmentiphaga sp. TaxID=1977564 RepID=UPI003B55EDEF